MQEIELFEEIKHLLVTQVQCVLATVDETQPCLHLMAYGVSENLKKVYLASYKDTRKVKNMLAQTNVSLLWDNRTGNTEDHVAGLALNATGCAHQLEGDACQRVEQLLLNRNSTLETLLFSDNVAVFAVDVSGYVFCEKVIQMFMNTNLCS